MMIDIQNEKNHVFNIRLAKLIGLYQVLDPETVKFRGRNVYHIITVCILLYMSVNSFILSLSGLYYWTASIPMSIEYFWEAVTSSFVIYKTWNVVYHSHAIWNCLSITCYSFTTVSHRDRHILDHWRKRSVWLTNIYVYLYLILMTFFVGCTLALSNSLTPVKNHDGSIGYYRKNLIDLYYLASDETYNEHFKMFFFVESLFIVLSTIAFIIFDTLLVTLCFAMCCQLQMISSAFESVGHRSLCDSHSSIDNTNEKKIISKHDLIYNVLKTIIMNHQAVMKKFEDFSTIFEQLILIQIVIGSFSLITLWFVLIMSFSNDDTFSASVAVIKKIALAIPLMSFQIFLLYYLFEKIHNHKDSIIFALYCSNWTEMDMKCKKLVLLTMFMNNANNKKFKFTRTKILSMEMFYKTMGDCYTVLSVLINYMKTKYD